MTAQAHAFPNGPASNVTYSFGYDDAGRDTSRTLSNPAFAEVAAPSSSYGAADALNRYPSVNGATQSYWAEGGLYYKSPRYRYYDETGAFAVASSENNGNELTSQTTDALGQTFQLNTLHPGGTDTLVYQGHGGLRPETLIDRTYTSANAQNAWAWQGDRVYLLGPSPDERLAYADTNGTVYYPHADRQGSTIALAAGGQDVLTRTYGPYGELSPAGNVTMAPGASAYPYLYTGQRFDPYLQAYDYKARIYDGKDGRFWQTDPIGNKDDLNLYAYVHDDPLDHGDPSGEAAEGAGQGGDGICIGTCPTFDQKTVIGLSLGGVYINPSAPGAGTVAAIGTMLIPGVGEERAAIEVGAAARGEGLLADGARALSKAASNGETAATKAGRAAHKAWDPGPGFEKEVRLPSGRRADAVNVGERHVKELKPDNARAVRRGERQVEGYRQELLGMHGGEWTGSVETYPR